MSRQKWLQKRGRRQKALLAFAWLVLLFALNLVLGLIPIFPFQARRQMEIRMEIPETKEIWQASVQAFDDYTYHLAINQDMAVFYKQRFSWLRGWKIGSTTLLSRSTEEPIVSSYLSSYYKDANEIYLMGYVNSDQVASVEYYYEWEDGTVKIVEIREESYIYYGDERYYLQIEDGTLWYHPTQGMESYPQERILRARDQHGNIIYEDR